MINNISYKVQTKSNTVYFILWTNFTRATKCKKKKKYYVISD